MTADPMPFDEAVCRPGCTTCGDVAERGVVLQLLHAGCATVDIDGEQREISIALVDAVAGDVVLVHAGEAIGMER